MHEMSLAGGILKVVDDAAEREPFARVQRLTLSAGALAGVEVRALRFALEAIAPGTRLFYGAFACNTCGRCQAMPTTVSFTLPTGSDGGAADGGLDSGILSMDAGAPVDAGTPSPTSFSATLSADGQRVLLAWLNPDAGTFDRARITRTVTESGPDGASYRVGIVDKDRVASGGKDIPTGTYLIDAAGQTKFRKVVIGTLIGTDLGIDRQPYKVLELTTAMASLGEGRYLVSDTGMVAYRADTASKFDAPKAQLFALIIDGTLGGDLPWGLVLIGVFLAIILELVGVSSLPFAVGLYLPIATSGGIFIGGAVRSLVDRKRKGESAASAEFSPGMLMASGLIAGGAIAGVIQSGVLTTGVDGTFDLSGALSLFGNGTWWPIVPFLMMAGGLYYVGTRKQSTPLPTAEVVDSKKD